MVGFGICEICRLKLLWACAEPHKSLCLKLIHSALSNDSVKRWPWLAFAFRICPPKNIFFLFRSKLYSLWLQVLVGWTYMLDITKTRIYNFDLLKPYFYIVKLGFTGVYIIFLILLKNIDCGYSLEPPAEAVLTSTHNLCFEQKHEKYQNFLSENFPFVVEKISIYLNRRVFVMIYIRKKNSIDVWEEPQSQNKAC